MNKPNDKPAKHPKPAIIGSAGLTILVAIIVLSTPLGVGHLNFPLLGLAAFILSFLAFIFFIRATGRKDIGLVVFAVLFSLISLGVQAIVNGYNTHYATSCSSPSDCNLYCGEGSFNKDYVPFDNDASLLSFTFKDCPPGILSSACVDNTCRYTWVSDIKTIEGCRRVSGEDGGRYYCIDSLIRKGATLDASSADICDDIMEGDGRQTYYKAKCLSIIAAN